MAKAARGLSISERSNGSWRAQVRKKGFPPSSKDFLTYEEADAWGMTILSEIRQTGRLVDRRPSERTTLAEAIERYITDVTAKRPAKGSSDPEAMRLRRFVRAEPHLCQHALAYVTSEMMTAWRDRRLTETVDRGTAAVPPAGRYLKNGSLRANAAVPKVSKLPKTIAPGTVHREMTLLKRVFDFSMAKFKLAANPLDRAHVERPSVQDQRSVRLDEAEWERLLTECRNTSNPWVEPFVEIALEVGLRRGSLLKLEWSDVYLTGAYLVLKGVKNSRKPSEVRTVEVGLSPRAIDILASFPRSILNGRVFQITQSALTSAFKRARKRAGVEHFRLHDTRHEMASRLVEHGWNGLRIMAQGDWRDPKSVARYYNAKGTNLGAELAKLPPRKSVA